MTRTIGNVLGSVGSLVVAFLLAAIVLAVSGYDVGATVSAMVEGATGSTFALTSTVQTAVPLTLAALGWAVAFRLGQINIGLEGQVIAGGICAVATAVALPDATPDLVRLLALVAAAVGGGVLAGVCALLQITRGVNLVISTFMTNFIMVLVLSWLIRGPLQNPAKAAHGQSEAVPVAASWPQVGTWAMSFDFVVVIAAVAALIGIERYTRLGRLSTIVGSNGEFAGTSGVRPELYQGGAVVVSGALAGLGGASLVLAVPGVALVDGFSGHVGYIGIAVALLARNALAGCLVAGLFIGGLQQGTSYAQVTAGVPGSLAMFLQGIVILTAGALAVWLSTLATRGLRRLRRPDGPAPLTKLEESAA